MALYEVLSAGILQLTPKTVVQIEAIADPKNGMVALCTDDSTSEVCLVSYDDTNDVWIVVETGSTMAD